MNQDFMIYALNLSLDNIDAGGGPFGAVVVKDGQMVGKGVNSVTILNDPTAHAEIMAIRDACKNLNTFELSGCEIYSSCEPCPMCLCAIMWARIKAVYYANDREDAAKIGFDDSYFYQQVSMPIDKRDILMQKINDEKSLIVFEKWLNKTDKIEY